MLKKYKPYVLFTEDEEIGCIGALKAVKRLEIPDIKYIIEIDRRGANDCVFYECGNEEFINYVESFGFTKNYGSCSDISIIGSSWDIAAVNVSSGYYNEHTNNEYVIFKQLLETIKRVDKMLKKIRKAQYFDYQEDKYTFDQLSQLFALLQSDVHNENRSKELSLKKNVGFRLGGCKR